MTLKGKISDFACDLLYENKTNVEAFRKELNEELLRYSIRNLLVFSGSSFIASLRISDITKEELNNFIKKKEK